MSAYDLLASLKRLWTAPVVIQGETRALKVTYSNPIMATPIVAKITLESKAQRKQRRAEAKAQKVTRLKVVQGGKR